MFFSWHPFLYSASHLHCWIGLELILQTWDGGKAYLSFLLDAEEVITQAWIVWFGGVAGSDGTSGR